MKIIHSHIIPFKGFSAITIWPFIFTREEMNKTILNHENIHGAQQKELLLIGFYLVYLIEWIFKGYRKVSFEVEAYQNEGNDNYLKSRKLFNMWKI